MFSRRAALRLLAGAAGAVGVAGLPSLPIANSLPKEESLKLGKLPASPPRVMLRDYITPDKLPPLPGGDFGHTSLINDWGVLGNDKVGDCLAEGTLVNAGGLTGGRKIPYDGEMITLKFASGKSLTVTPNHAVLTPRGFTLARFLKEGDDCIGADGGQVLKALYQEDCDYAPAPVEEVFESLRGSSDVTARRLPVVPSVDLDGDERFFDGYVDIVTTSGSLRREVETPLGEPEGKCEVRLGSEPKRALASSGPPDEAFLAGGTPPLGGVSRASHGLPLVGRKPGVAQGDGGAVVTNFVASLNQQPPEIRTPDARLLGKFGVALTSPVPLKEVGEVAQFEVTPGTKRLPGRAALYASSEQPSSDGHTTDPNLAANLVGAFPGHIELDTVIEVNRHWLHGFVYDLSTEVRWLVTDGIVTHNCAIAGPYHGLMLWNRMADVTIPITDQAVLSAYSAITGYNPNAYDPVTRSNPTDRGSDVQDVAEYWRTTGLADAAGGVHKIDAYVALEPGNIEELWHAILLFDAVGIGVNFPKEWMNAFNAGIAWDVVGQPHNIGGHLIQATGRRSGMIQVITWGRVQNLTVGGYQQFSDECYAYLSEDKLVGGRDIDGFDLAQLKADLQDLAA